MKKINRALLYLQRIADRSKPDPVSSLRICWYLLDHLKFDAVWHHKDPAPDPLPDVIEELWFVCSSWAFLEDRFRKQTYKVFPRAKRVIWCNNDVNVPFHSYHLGRVAEDAQLVALTTVKKTLDRIPGRIVNWNRLTYRPDHPVVRARERQEKFFYYGSFRPGRLDTFDLFFPGLAKKLVVAAANGKDAKRYAARYPEIEVVPRVDDVFEALSGYAATLLLEDDFAADHFVSPPNRFYEALTSRTAMIFDPANVDMWDLYGYDVSDYVAFDARQAKKLLKSAQRIALRQASAWRRDFSKDLDQDFNDALALIKRGKIGRRGPPETVKRYYSETIGSK